MQVLHGVDLRGRDWFFQDLVVQLCVLVCFGMQNLVGLVVVLGLKLELSFQIRNVLGVFGI